MRSVLITAWVVAACADATATLAPVSDAPRVRVATVSAATAGPEVHLHGVTRSGHAAAVGFPVGGRVIAMQVDAGDRVRAGEILARLEATPSAARVDALAASRDAAAADLAQLDRDRDRLEALAGDRAVATQQAEQLAAATRARSAQVAALDAQLAEARWAADATVLRAPFDGVVVRRAADVGAVLAPGAPVVHLSGSGAVSLDVDLPERHLTLAQPGTTGTVSFPLAGLPPVRATIEAVGESADARGLFPVRLALDPVPGLRAGLTATLALAAPPPDDAVEAPLAAVVAPSGLRTTVYRLSAPDVVTTVDVAVAGLLDDRVLLRGALSPGDEVVVAGHVGLRAGSPVEVAR